MSKKKNTLIKMATLLLAMAPMIATRASGFWFVGEPKMPTSLQKRECKMKCVSS